MVPRTLVHPQEILIIMGLGCHLFLRHSHMALVVASGSHREQVRFVKLDFRFFSIGAFGESY